MEEGYLALAVLGCDQPDVEALKEAAELALSVAAEFGDPVLEARALSESGFALVVRGHLAEGFARLDEAMAAVTAGEVPDPAVTAKCFCAMLAACDRCGDVRRAQEWTAVVSGFVAGHDGRPRRPDAGASALSRREREVLDLLCQGLTNAEIAARLYISPKPPSITSAPSLPSSGCAAPSGRLSASGDEARGTTSAASRPAASKALRVSALSLMWLCIRCDADRRAWSALRWSAHTPAPSVTHHQTPTARTLV